MEEFITQAEAARLRGCSRSRIYSILKHPEHSKNIRRKGKLVHKEDIINLPSRIELRGRPKKEVIVNV